MGAKPSQKRRRDEATHCFYCNCELTHEPYPARQDGPLPDSLATIEHLNSRLQYPNGRPMEDDAIVIACYRCNHDRAELEDALLLNKSEAS